MIGAKPRERAGTGRTGRTRQTGRLALARDGGNASEAGGRDFPSLAHDYASDDSDMIPSCPRRLAVLGVDGRRLSR